jgi:hypothetical protein
MYAGVLAFLFSAICVGLMISALSVTQQQGLLGGLPVYGPSRYPFSIKHFSSMAVAVLTLKT